jgi:UDP-N-acetylglucosamine 3-dehydrogenase
MPGRGCGSVSEPTPCLRPRLASREGVSAPLGLAFLGCGSVTATHSRTLRSFSSVARYYASRDADRARAFARAHRGAGWYGSYDDALADPRVGVVLIATPPARHAPLALAALDAGKHVLIEKPAFPEAGAFDEVERAAREAGRIAFVTENYFYKPLARTLRTIVARGDLGAVRFVHVDATKRQRVAGWRADPTLAGGGALFEGGIHWLTFMAHLGLDVAAVDGYRAGGPADGERSSAVVFRYAQGAVGTLLHSWEVPSPFGGARLSAIRGTEGSATFESNGLWVAVGARRPRLRVGPLRDLLGYRAMFADVFEAIRRERQPVYDLGRARRDLELMERACGRAAVPADRLAWSF